MAGRDGEPPGDGADDGELATKVGRSRPRKAPGAFRTISEVADELHIPQHVLRFWETKFTHVRPLKRGGGRRYYRPDDVELLRRISGLLYIQGYTIKGVQRLLREGNGRLDDEVSPPKPEDAEEPQRAQRAGVPELPMPELAMPELPMPELPMPELPMPELAMPGLAPVARARKRAAVPPARASVDDEAARLREVLRMTLDELRAIRAMLR